nr:hypothetical protein GCM10017745_36470 [Saccharothrix mutabilis subsp. capreolus]
MDGWVSTAQIYNQLMHVELDPSLPPDTVLDALTVLVAVQPGLRQVFLSLPELHARLHPAAHARDLPLERVDSPAPAYAAACSALAAKLGGEPFDLHAGPAYRFGYVRATDGSAAAVVLCAHHVVGDGGVDGSAGAGPRSGVGGQADHGPGRRARDRFRARAERQNRTATAQSCGRRTGVGRAPP